VDRHAIRLGHVERGVSHGAGSGREIVPFEEDPAQRPEKPLGTVFSTFLKSNPASVFYPSGTTQF
jgi:hypothetical protein